MVPFVLLPWQRFVVYSIFGWVMDGGRRDRYNRLPNTRRYRRCLLMTGRGSGKSSLAGAIAAYMMVADGRQATDDPDSWVPEPTPQGFVTGTTQDQAKRVGIGIIQQMILGTQFCEEIAGEFRGGAAPDEFYCGLTGGRLVAVGSRPGGKGKGGMDVSFLQGEELSEWESTEQFDLLESGFRGRPQPLTMLLTNAGAYRDGPAWEARQQAELAVTGKGNDTMFAFVAEIRDRNIPRKRREWFPPVGTWEMANPSLGHTMRRDYLRGQIAKGQDGTEGQRHDILRLNFGLWRGAVGSIVSMQDYEKRVVERIDPPEDAHVYIGIDLGSRNDLTAMAVVYRRGDQVWGRVRQWTGAGRLPERDKESSGHLVYWSEEGWIETTPGSTLDYGAVAIALRETLEVHPDATICMDIFSRDQFFRAAALEGLTLIAEGDKGSGHVVYMHPQGYQMAPKGKLPLRMHDSIDAFRSLILEGCIDVEESPVLRWNLVNCELEGNRKGYRISKRRRGTRARGTDDGIVALVMACGLSELETPQPPERTIWTGDDNPFLL